MKEGVKEPVEVWALASGEYSDYHILALFPTQELAEGAVQAATSINPKAARWSTPYVQSFFLHSEVPEPVTVWQVSETIYINGQVAPESYFEWENTFLPWGKNEAYTWDLNVSSKRSVHVEYELAPDLDMRAGRLHVRGLNRQAVLQAFSDRKAQIIAQAHLNPDFHPQPYQPPST